MFLPSASNQALLAARQGAAAGRTARCCCTPHLQCARGQGKIGCEPRVGGARPAARPAPYSSGISRSGLPALAYLALSDQRFAPFPPRLSDLAASKPCCASLPCCPQNPAIRATLCQAIGSKHVLFLALRMASDTVKNSSLTEAKFSAPAT